MATEKYGAPSIAGSEGMTIIMHRDVNQQILAWEQETERLMIKEIVEQRQQLQNVQSTKNGEAETAATGPSGLPLNHMLHFQGNGDDKELILSTYLCDFGNVLKGSQRKRSFKITNTGMNLVSLYLSN